MTVEEVALKNDDAIDTNNENNEEMVENRDENLNTPEINENKNDENAWVTSLSDREVLEVLRETGMDIGVDIAASSFYKRKKYNYQNPLFKRTIEEQRGYLMNLLKNFVPPLMFVFSTLRNPELTSFDVKIKVCLVMFFIRYVTALEMIKLQFRGIPSRAHGWPEKK